VTRRVVLAAILIGGAVALFVLQWSRASAPISPRPLLYLVADTERESERIPPALTRVSDEEENAAGEKIAQEEGLEQPGELSLEDTRATAYLNRVGSAVAAHVHRRGIRYRFYLSNDKGLVNAYALPGGYIIVGRGLINLLRSEDALAAVLGHEIAHVDDRHAVERLQYELASQKLGLQDVYHLGRPAVQLFQAGYTKEQELEADRVGLEYAVQAGYSPAGILQLMEDFEKLEAQTAPGPAPSPIDEIAGVPWAALQEYFRSHPPATERKAALESEIRKMGWNGWAPVRPLETEP
jgi:beta-barrel assembly-enhancing protease